MSARDDLLGELLNFPPSPCESELCDCDEYQGARERRLVDAYRAEILREAAKKVDLLAEYYEGEADIPTELNKNAVRVMRMVVQRIELMAAWPDVEEEK